MCDSNTVLEQIAYEKDFQEFLVHWANKAKTQCDFLRMGYLEYLGDRIRSILGDNIDENLIFASTTPDYYKQMNRFFLSKLDYRTLANYAVELAMQNDGIFETDDKNVREWLES